MDTSSDISIVIPAYNEQERLGPTLDRILDFVRLQKWHAEIIVVDGASQDHTADIVREYAQHTGIIRLLRNKTNRGKGYCVRKGVMEARGQIILFTDADLSSPIEEVTKLLQAIEVGADMAIGSRWVRSELQTRRQSPARQVMGRAFNLLLRGVLSLDFKDTQCGFKAFRQNAARTVFSQQQIERWGFDAEILFLARQAGLKVVEVPVRWAHDRRTKIHPIVDGACMVGEILSIRWHSLCGTYGAKHSQAHGESGGVHTFAQSPAATPLASEFPLGD